MIDDIMSEIAAPKREVLTPRRTGNCRKLGLRYAGRHLSADRQELSGGRASVLLAFSVPRRRERKKGKTTKAVHRLSDRWLRPLGPREDRRRKLDLLVFVAGKRCRRWPARPAGRSDGYFLPLSSKRAETGTLPLLPPPPPQRLHAGTDG